MVNSHFLRTSNIMCIYICLQTGTERRRDLNSCIDENTRPKFQNSFCSIGATDCRTLKDRKNRDTTITLLKKEIECALESLKEVQDELAKLYKEKEKFVMSGKDCERSIEALMHEVLVLQGGMDCFEAEFQSKMDALNSKLQRYEEIVQHSCTSWFQEKEVGYSIRAIYHLSLDFRRQFVPNMCHISFSENMNNK